MISPREAGAARRAAVTVVFILAAGLAAAPAQGFEYLCRGWRITGYQASGCPSGYQETDSCGCAPSQPATVPRWYGGQLALQIETQGGNGVTAAQFVAVARRAARSWSDISCSTLVLDASQSIAPTNAARFGAANNNNSDREHGVFFVTSSREWMQVTGSGAGSTLGVTVSPWQSFGCNDREFYDTDILINGFLSYGWDLVMLESTILHEMGHAIGLGHPCLGGYTNCSSWCSSVMAATGGTDYVTPQQDDVNALCALYPGVAGGLGSSCNGPQDGSCRSGPCIIYEGFGYCTKLCGDCPSGYRCAPHAGQQVCVRKGSPTVGEPCTGSCAEGAQCVGVRDDGGECLAVCDPSAPACPDDTRCAQLENGDGVCVPPGSQQLGEACGTAETGTCAAGLLCLGDSETLAHCYRECSTREPGMCGSAAVCFDMGADADAGAAPADGVCLAAAGEGADCLATQGICKDGYECTPFEGGADADADAYTCHRICDYADAASCGANYTCETFVDQDGHPAVGACYPLGDKIEGDLCVAATDCAAGHYCVMQSEGDVAECLIACDPDAAACPHTGQSCYGLGGSEDGVCYPPGGQAAGGGGASPSPSPGDGGSTGGGGSGDGGSPKPEGDSCRAASECEAGLVCVDTGSSSGAQCAVLCDPSAPVCTHASQRCVSIGGSSSAGACLPPVALPTSSKTVNPIDSGGCACAVSDRRTGGALPWWFAALGVAWVWRRRGLCRLRLGQI